MNVRRIRAVTDGQRAAGAVLVGRIVQSSRPKVDIGEIELIVAVEARDGAAEVVGVMSFSVPVASASKVMF